MDLTLLLPLLLIVLVFYFLIIRPQRARQKAAAQMQQELQAGAKVMTTAGLFGTVTAIGDDYFEMEIAPGVVVRHVKPALARVVDETPPAEPSDSGPAE